MTTKEIAISNAQTVQVARTAAAVTEDLRQQVEQMKLAAELAETLCKTPLVPDAYRGKPAEGAVAIMAGATWGLDPIAALQNIFIVKGTPSTYARTMAAVVMSHGHQIETIESSATKVVLRVKRKGSENWQKIEWTIERATLAGYTRSNPKYRTEPENMIYARALAEGSRRVAPDALLGMAYSTEELRDVQIIEGEAERITTAEDPLRAALNLPAAEKAKAEEAAKAVEAAKQDEAPAAVDVASLLKAIPEITDIDQLKALWLENRGQLADEDRAKVSQQVTARLEALRKAEEEAKTQEQEPPAAEDEPIDAETVDEPPVSEEEAAAAVADLFSGQDQG